MTQDKKTPTTFPIGIGEAFGAGWDGYKSNALGITLAGAVPLSILFLARLVAAGIANPWTSFFTELALVVVASSLALPWYRAALAAIDGEKFSFREQLQNFDRFKVLIGGSIYFWAAILLGFRYWSGLPSLLVLVLYAFYGFVVADSERGVIMSLSYSVFVGQGRRIGIFAIITLLLMFNFLAFLPIGLGVTVATPFLVFVLLAITTSFSMVCGAAVYRALDSTTERRE